MRMVRSGEKGTVTVSCLLILILILFLLYRYNLLAKKLRIVTKNARRYIGLVTSYIALQNVKGPHSSSNN
jgi:hypothetical protein